MSIFSMRAMNDSAPLARPRSLSSHAYFLGDCHTTACPSLANTNLPRAQGVNHFLHGELEAA